MVPKQSEQKFAQVRFIIGSIVDWRENLQSTKQELAFGLLRAITHFPKHGQYIVFVCSLLPTFGLFESTLVSIWQCQHSTPQLYRHRNGLDGAWWRRQVVDCLFHLLPQPLRGRLNHHGAVVCKGKVRNGIPLHHPIETTRRQHHPYQQMIFKRMLPGDTLWTSTLCKYSAHTCIHPHRLLLRLAIDATTATTKPFHQRCTITNCFLSFPRYNGSFCNATHFGRPLFSLSKAK